MIIPSVSNVSRQEYFFFIQYDTLLTSRRPGDSSEDKAFAMHCEEQSQHTQKPCKIWGDMGLLQYHHLADIDRRFPQKIWKIPEVSFRPPCACAPAHTAGPTHMRTAIHTPRIHGL